MAEKEQALEVEGVVTQALANTRFRVQIAGGHIVNAHVAGRDAEAVARRSGIPVAIGK